MYFFSSDTHFNDYDTLLVDKRPFKSAKAFDKFVLKTWNKQAGKKDTIFVVGDFVDCDGAGSRSWEKSIKYVQKLKANVVLICGNNEDRVIKNFFDNDFESFRRYCLNIGFKDVHKSLTITFDNIEFYLVHKPINHKDGVINLYGHIHRSGGLYKPYGYNIGCDLNHFRLFSQKDIHDMIKMQQSYWDKDENLKF